MDHIFLFSHPDEVRSIICEAGLRIVEENYFVANQCDLQKALERKFPILMVGILEKKE